MTLESRDVFPCDDDESLALAWREALEGAAGMELPGAAVFRTSETRGFAVVDARIKQREVYVEPPGTRRARVFRGNRPPVDTFALIPYSQAMGDIQFVNVRFINSLGDARLEAEWGERSASELFSRRDQVENELKGKQRLPILEHTIDHVIPEAIHQAEAEARRAAKRKSEAFAARDMDTAFRHLREAGENVFFAFRLRDIDKPPELELFPRASTRLKVCSASAGAAKWLPRYAKGEPAGREDAMDFGVALGALGANLGLLKTALAFEKKEAARLTQLGNGNRRLEGPA